VIRDIMCETSFMGNMAFAQNVHSHHIEDAIALTGDEYDLPQVTRDGVTGMLCIPYHARGACYRVCPRAATHTHLSTVEVDAPLPMHEAGAGDTMINHLSLVVCPPWDRALALWKVLLKTDIRLSTILI
jgi:hypothetical protein